MEEGQPHLGLSELLDQDPKGRSRLFFRATASGGKRPAKERMKQKFALYKT